MTFDFDSLAKSWQKVAFFNYLLNSRIFFTTNHFDFCILKILFDIHKYENHEYVSKFIVCLAYGFLLRFRIFYSKITDVIQKYRRKPQNSAKIRCGFKCQEQGVEFCFKLNIKYVNFFAYLFLKKVDFRWKKPKEIRIMLAKIYCT